MMTIMSPPPTTGNDEEGTLFLPTDVEAMSDTRHLATRGGSLLNAVRRAEYKASFDPSLL